MKKLFPLILLLGATAGYAQPTNTDLIDFNKSRNSITTRGLQGLGIFAAANMGASGILYYNSNGSEKYFHQMNVMFNGVNATIVIVSLLPKDRNDIGLTKTLQWQSNTEATYLTGAALDLFYASAGVYLCERAKNEPANWERFNGWGSSLIYNGLALFVFDTGMYIVHKRNGRRLMKMVDNISISTSGLGMKATLQF